ncbi:MAG TPA: Nif3-like dinuclear metal center hexameric protein, partial [Coriobacteriia bacterium]|nr:Nif3-like dinuclear metal center hexameric protein [Coriobacteriia bacterium]
SARAQEGVAVSVRVADVLQAVHDRFPPEWAEPWDRVGLLAGDPAAVVERVFVSLDATPSALRSARAAGAQVLATHHPAFLTAPEALVPARAGVTFEAVASGVALMAAHTNLDRAPAAAMALPRMLGIREAAPLEDNEWRASLVTVYVPQSHEAQVASAMAAAGAGRIGEYTGCSFSAAGIGRFIPPAEGEPFTGVPGVPSSAEEVRLEMVAPKGRAAGVVAAARDSHPYEEPLVVVADVAVARGTARLGRVGALEAPTTLSAFADAVARVFDVTPRVWGERDHGVSVVATATGSAGSLVPAAIGAGAHVLLAGEVRYHDARAAHEAGLAVIEIGHDTSEWPLVPVLAEAIGSAPGLADISVIVDSPTMLWWNP